MLIEGIKQVHTNGKVKKDTSWTLELMYIYGRRGDAVWMRLTDDVSSGSKFEFVLQAADVIRFLSKEITVHLIDLKEQGFFEHLGEPTWVIKLADSQVRLDMADNTDAIDRWLHRACTQFLEREFELGQMINSPMDGFSGKEVPGDYFAPDEWRLERKRYV